MRQAEYILWLVLLTEKLEGKRLNKHFGYITMTSSRDNVLCKKGEQFTAHEFHYYNSTNDGHDFKAVKPVGGFEPDYRKYYTYFLRWFPSYLKEMKK